MFWNLTKGDKITRKDLHDHYGGIRQGGVSPSRTSPNIFLFSDYVAGEQHGYNDRWLGEIFLYVGEGQKGDQEMVRRNKSILNHATNGQALRVFWGSTGEVEYAGRFEIDETEPWFYEKATSKETGQRNVVVFRLREVLTVTHTVDVNGTPMTFENSVKDIENLFKIPGRRRMPITSDALQRLERELDK